MMSAIKDFTKLIILTSSTLIYLAYVDYQPAVC